MDRDLVHPEFEDYHSPFVREVEEVVAVLVAAAESARL